MSYRALDSIISMMWKEDQVTQESAVRALANLAAPAGVISESAESLAIKAKAAEELASANQNDGEGGEGDEGGEDGLNPTKPLELKTESNAPVLPARLPSTGLELVGRFGSPFIPPEDVEEEEKDDKPSPSPSPDVIAVEAVRSQAICRCL